MGLWGRSAVADLEISRPRSDVLFMDILDTDLPEDTQNALEKLSRRYSKASGGGIEIINALGGTAESWLRRLPEPVRDGLDTATRAALQQSVKAAKVSRDAVPDQPPWVNGLVGATMGAVGGFGGAPTALAELPVTTTLLLRVIQGVAAEYGFDPSEDSVQFDCVTVFASAGPLEQDDGSETAFLAARLSLNGAALSKIIQTVAPRLAASMGQKLAAQAVPVLGAAAGAAINYAYVCYYREMAHVAFGLRRLAIEADVPEPVLLEEMRRSLAKPPVKQA